MTDEDRMLQIKCVQSASWREPIRPVNLIDEMANLQRHGTLDTDQIENLLREVAEHRFTLGLMAISENVDATALAEYETIRDEETGPRPISITLHQGQHLAVEVEDGTIFIRYGEDRFFIHADTPDTKLREGIIYCEHYGDPDDRADIESG